MLTIPNPTRPRGLTPVRLLTDRAKRLRARRSPPDGPKRCHYCGAAKPRDIDHVDGNESHGQRHNLAWACRTCNTRKGVAFRDRGRGVRTRQFNPAGGARNLAQYVQAVMALRGEGDMKLSDAIAMMHATPHTKRAEFAAEIWRRRRARGSDKKVPF